jgi:hypothetical protein
MSEITGTLVRPRPPHGTGPDHEAQARRAGRWAAAVAAVYGVVQLVAVVPGSGLGWDETVYTSQVSGSVPAAFFSAPRARGISFLAAPIASWTGSTTALRVWFAVLSALGLFLALRTWRTLVPPAVVALAGGLFATLWISLYYGPQVMPNLWSAYGALAAVAFFLRLLRDPGDRRSAAGLAAAVTLSGLMRPPDAFWLVLPIAATALLLRAGRRPLVWAALATGVVLGCAEWVIEAYVRYGGLSERLDRASAIQGGTGWNFAVDDQVRALDGHTLCRPCTVPWRHPADSVWFFVLPVLAVAGLWAAHRAGRRATALLPLLTAASTAFPYLFLIGYAAPRFLLPAYALAAIPVAWCLRAAFLWAGSPGTAGTGSRTSAAPERPPAAPSPADAAAPGTHPAPLPHPRRRALVLRRSAGAVLAVLLCGHLAVQAAVLTSDVRSNRTMRRDYGTVAASLHSAGVRPPCVLSGDHAVPMAFYAGCSSRQVGGPDGSITPAGLRRTALHRPVALLVRGGRPSYARGWRLLRLPDLPAFHGYRAYVARPAGRQ